MHAHAVLPTPGKRLPARRVLASAFALATTIQAASASITFDLRAFDITTGIGSIANGGKSVMLDGAGNVTLQIWAQVTNAAPTNNIFGVQNILGAIVSSNDVGITGSVDPMSFPAVFSAAAIPGVNNEFSAPPDTILDLGTSSTTSNVNYPKARKDPTTGGESVVPGSTMFATNNQPAGATVNPIANGYEFLMGVTTFHITNGPLGSSATLNWKIPGFTTAALRGSIAQWTDGDGLNNTGSAQFAEMSVGPAVNFSIALAETTWASTGGGSWGQSANWSSSVPGAGSNAILGSAIVAPATVTLDGDRSVGIMTFNSPIAYTVAQGTGGTLTGATKIDDLGGSHTIATPVSMATSGLNVDVANVGDTLTISGAIGGSGGLQKNGAGRLLLTNANTYAGTTTINAGTLELNTTGANAIAGHVYLAGGTLRLLQSEQINNARNLSVGLGTLDLGGNTETVNFMELSGGAIVGGGQLISPNYYSVQSGLISVSLAGNVDLSKTTAGTVTLTKPASYTGVTTIGAGTLEVNVTEGTAIPGNVEVSGGTLKLNVAGVTGIAGNVNVSGGTLESNGTAGTAIAGNVNLAGGTLRLLQSNQIADNRSVTVAAGTLDLGGNSETVASVQLANGSIIGSGTLTSLSNYDVRTGMVSANLAGNVALAKTTASTVTLSGSNTYQGGTSIAAGILSITGASALPSGKPVNIGTGALHLQAISNQTIGTLTGNGSVVLAGSGMFTLGADGGSGTFGGTISGPGASLIKTGAGEQTLSGNNTYSGLTTVLAGRLILSGQSASTSFVAENGGTLRFDGAPLNLAAGSLRANAGGAIEYKNNVTINGGFLRGPGTHSVLSGGTINLNGVTTFNSTNLAQNGAANLTNFSNGGTITNGAVLSWDGGVNSSSGRVTVNNTANVRDWTNDGVVTVNAGGVLSNTGSDLVSGGGSRITVQSGGQLNVETGFSLDLQGSLLVNNGTINGATEIYYGATAKGAGVFGSLAVFDGGTFSPGNSPGTATINGTYVWGAGGKIDFEIVDALGAAGASNGWDSVNVIGPAGFLDVAAGTTPNSRFTIHIASNDVNNNLPALNFDSSASYDWLLVDTTQGIVGFDPAEIAIDASDFVNPLDGGSFSVVENGDQLFVAFRPVPEPSCAGLLLGALTVFGFISRRRVA